MPTHLPIADLHQDLLSHVEAREVFGDEFQTSFLQLSESPVKLVVASTFNMHKGARVISDENEAYSRRLMEEYQRLSGEKGFVQVLSGEDIVDDADGIRLLVHVEGVQTFQDTVEQVLQSWWDLGCRSVGPMWNLDNGIGGGPGDPDIGLSSQGKRLVQWLDGAPMVLDVSHMGKATFWDTLNSTEGIVIASHSNARHLTDNPRNLWDDQLKAIAERGGVVGLVLSQRFLGLSRNLDAVVEHATYIADLIGSEHLALGSDLGGLEDLIPEVPTVERLEELSERFIAEFGVECARAILWDNALRALRESLAAPPPEI